ncbi:MAG: FAD:protein FMN transferase [Planctomycetota bacterium]|nr:FAD:protein FMN transferase [Planctomycetota bacterium]
MGRERTVRRRLLYALFALGFVCGVSYSLLRNVFDAETQERSEVTVTTHLFERNLVGCEEKEYVRYASVLGTSMKVIVHCKSREIAWAATEAAVKRVVDIERKMSRFLPESELYNLNRSAYNAPFVTSEELFEVIRRSLEFCEASGGALDITVVPLLEVYKNAAQKGVSPTKEDKEAALKRVGWQRVVLDIAKKSVRFAVEGMALDLGATAKGYAVDCALKVIEGYGIKNALVEIGGEVRVCGGQANGREWLIGITDPRKSHEYLRKVGFKEGAIATSGNYERYYEVGGRRFSHIVDPRTGESCDYAVSVSVIAADCFTADSLATAVSVLGPEEGLAFVKRFPGVEVFILWKDERGERFVESEGFAGYMR